MPSLVGTIADAFARSGVDLGALGLAWARVTPAVTLVPAFGLRALPAPARAVMALRGLVVVDRQQQAYDGVSEPVAETCGAPALVASKTAE